MNRNDMKAAYDRLTPDAEAKTRMLSAIMAEKNPSREGKYQSYAQPAPRRWWTAIPAALALVAVLAVGIFLVNRQGEPDVLSTGDTTHPSAATESTAAEGSYEQLLDLYAQAISEGWGPEACSEADISIRIGRPEYYPVPGYQFMDIDHNGVEELLITDGDIIYDLYTQVDGQILRLFTSGERDFYRLCEGYVISYQGARSASSTVYQFFKWENDTLVQIEEILFDQSDETNSPWFRVNSGDGTNLMLEPITEEQANEIIDSYSSVSIEVTAFPLEDTVKTTEYPQAVEDFMTSLFYWNAMEYTDWVDSDVVPNQFEKQAEIAEYFGMNAYTGDDRGTDNYNFFLEEVGLESILREDVAGVIWDIEACRWYDDQRFNVVGSVDMAWEASPWTVPVDFNIYRTTPEYLLPALSEMGPLENYEFWEYTLSSGGTAILARNGEIAYVIVYRAEEVWFTAVDNSQQVESDQTMTREALEAFADLFTYEIVYKTETDGERVVDTEPEYSLYDQYLVSQYGSSDVEHKFSDLDNDGIDELLVYSGVTITDVVTIKNGAAESILSGFELFLSADGIIGDYGEGSGGCTVFFYKIEDQTAVKVECIVWLFSTCQWYRSTDFSGNWETLQPITDEERQEILEKYPCPDVEYIHDIVYAAK